MRNALSKVFFVLVLAVLATGGVFAQEWYDSYAPGITDNKLFINAGSGFGPTGGFNMGLPPISASVDFKLPISLPITVGGIVVFTTWKYSTSAGIPNSNIDVTYMNFGFGGRGMYHFNFLKNLDAYAGATLGYVYQNASVRYGSAYDTIPKTSYTGAPFLLWGSNIGARYFFTNLIGVYLELGYSGLHFANTGVSLKF